MNQTNSIKTNESHCTWLAVLLLAAWSIVATTSCARLSPIGAETTGAASVTATVPAPAATPYHDADPEFDIASWYEARAAASPSVKDARQLGAKEQQASARATPRQDEKRLGARERDSREQIIRKEDAAGGDRQPDDYDARDAEDRSSEAAASAARNPTARDATAFDPAAHGALIATLEPGRTIAAHNPDKTFNPASLVKLATSLVALRRLGPDYRFEIRVHANGQVKPDGTLDGELYFVGSFPTFNDTAADLVADELARQGIKRVSGGIRVSPDFCYNFSDSPAQFASYFTRALRLTGNTRVEVSDMSSGAELFTLRSHTLRELLLYMNTHSSNFVAHRVGDAIGGAAGVRQYLIDELQLPPEQVVLATTSGLEHNEMTARGLLIVMRALAAETRRRNIELVDILPVANERRSTLRRRFPDHPLKDATLAKTGTLRDIDGGVANLAGVIRTQDAGDIVFALLDQGTRLEENRQLQDDLLRDAVGNKFALLPVSIPAERELLGAAGLSLEDGGGYALSTTRY